MIDLVALPTRQLFDQGSVNCCLSCALASAMEAGDRTTPALAPLFHFHFAGGQASIVEGISLSEAQAALLRSGMCALERHPFRISPENVGRAPAPDAVVDGLQRRPIDRDAGTLLWKPMSTAAPSSWKRTLAAGSAIVVALQPNADYRALTSARPTLTSNSGPYESTGHAAAIIGCRDAEQLFVVQDSRGPAFGVRGQWFLPYDLCTSPFIVLAFALVADNAD